MTKNQRQVEYEVRASLIPGTSYSELYKHAKELFKNIKSKTKRKPHIRSAYFKKQKVFFDYFWQHLTQKSLKDRTRRIKYLNVGIELIANSRINPTQSFVNQRECLYRFTGQTRDKQRFVVQIKLHKKTNTLQLISIFPIR